MQLCNANAWAKDLRNNAKCAESYANTKTAQMARKVGGYAPSTAVVNAANIQTAKTVH